jgi:putative ABC transport system ATP-binding protein
VSTDPLVECRGLTKTYLTASGGIDALHGVDATFFAGAVTAVVGPSGSGKSTLLRAIAGLDHPSSGELTVAGADLAPATSGSLRRHRRHVVTYVSQKPADNYIPYLSLGEHALDAGGASLELLDDVGLSHRLDMEPVELSGGEQARGAFALALARGAPLIVIDEPTAELDRDSAAPLLAAIRRHTTTGRSVIVATHDPDVIAAADQVLRLERGRVRSDAVVQPARSASARPAPGGDLALSATGLQKSFHHGGRHVHALQGVSLQVRRGEVAVLLGRSGSGKSTLLSLLAGWQQPDAGRIDYGPDAAPPPSWSVLGYLPQRFGLMPDLSVRENVELPAALSGRLDELTPRVEQLLHDLGLHELGGRIPAETSIGQQQRTALARALVLRPTLLVADEPTSHQDARWRDAVWEQLVGAARSGTACLIATHEDQAASYATRVWRIGEGKLAEAGSAPS